MPDRPLVSIVTPSFNQGRFLEETVLSVLRQDYPNVEYFIIDGGSSDNSTDVIRRYSARLAYWVSERDRGQTDAIIKGFQKARGKYVMWLCSDDLLEPSMIEISVDYQERHPDVAVTYGDRIRIDARGNIYSLQRYPEFRRWFPRMGLGLPQETTLIRRTALDDVGGLDHALQMAMDFDLWCRINKKFAIRHIPAILGRFRAHSTNKSTAFSLAESENSETGRAYFEEYARVYRRHFGQPLPALGKAAAKRLLPVLAFFDRRTLGFRRELDRAARLRLAENP